MTDTYTDPFLDVTWLAQDDMIVRWLRQEPGRRFEPISTPWMLAQMGEREGAYVDVGASTGWFAIPMAKRGYKVIAFECNARSAQRLRDNCALNDVYMTIHPVAVTDRIGTAIFTHNPRLPLTSGGSLERVPANKASEAVPCATLDSLIDEPVSFIKIDVEGHELAVLRGAERVIAENRPAMVLEANTPAHMAQLAEWCKTHEYVFTIADTRNMLCLPAS
jgi:FkbM family methyltransferase